MSNLISMSISWTFFFRQQITTWLSRTSRLILPLTWPDWFYICAWNLIALNLLWLKTCQFEQIFMYVEPLATKHLHSWSLPVLFIAYLILKITKTNLFWLVLISLHFTNHFLFPHSLCSHYPSLILVLSLADMIFVKLFTPAHFQKFENLPQKNA